MKSSSPWSVYCASMNRQIGVDCQVGEGTWDPEFGAPYRPVCGAVLVWVRTQVRQTCFRKLLTVLQIYLWAVRKFVQQRS